MSTTWRMVAGVAAACMAWPVLAAGCAGESDHEQVTISATYKMQGEQIVGVSGLVADPARAEITRGGSPDKVCWTVTNLEDKFTISIRAKSREGNPPAFGGRSFGVSSAGDSASSGTPETGGDWHYEVEIKKGDISFVLDPVVIINDVGQGGG